MILVVLLLCSILQVWVMGTKSRAILCIDIGSAVGKHTLVLVWYG
uniref:Uncharacterized protein n=1 Tax=Amphimedon queenslandica TaxID=400682 RepID=A0A1X7SJD7_AMPQE